MKEIRVPLEWGSLAAICRGPESGHPYLLLHGWLDNAASFDALSGHLPKDWRTVALDLPGHGTSDHRPAGTIYHLADALLDIMRVADHFEWEKFSLVGHSLGGGAATFLAGAFPDRIEKLILLEALGPLSSPATETPDRLAQLYEQQNALLEKRLPVYTGLDVAVRARIQAGGLTPEAAKTLTARSIQNVEGGVTWRSDRRLRLPTQRFTEDQVRAFLSKIQCPTLGLFADKGMVLTMPGWETRAKLIRTLTWHKVAGGHHVHMEDPELIGQSITNWV